MLFKPILFHGVDFVASLSGVDKLSALGLLVGGIGVMNVGHGHPRVMEAITKQLERVTHASVQVVMYESYLRLAQRLSELLGPAEQLDLSIVEIAKRHFEPLKDELNTLLNERFTEPRGQLCRSRDECRRFCDQSSGDAQC